MTAGGSAAWGSVSAADKRSEEDAGLVEWSARTAEDVRREAAGAPNLGVLAERVAGCRACPRLVQWREEVARTRRRAFADQTYWGRPVPGWGADSPRLLVVGLAPAAHGGNRTGRIFTGDRSGDWLFASLHRTGWAARPDSVGPGDGQRLIGARMLAAVRCAPPENKPTVEERDTCLPWMVREVAFCLPSVRVVVALGAFAWRQSLVALGALGWRRRAGRGPTTGGPTTGGRTTGGPAASQPGEARRRGGGLGGFAHGAEVVVYPLPDGSPDDAGGHSIVLLGSYHPSQQNTFTGRLTESMLDAVFQRAARVAEDGASWSSQRTEVPEK